MSTQEINAFLFSSLGSSYLTNYIVFDPRKICMALYQAAEQVLSSAIIRRSAPIIVRFFARLITSPKTFG
jgi:hypothetical protein